MTMTDTPEPVPATAPPAVYLAWTCHPLKRNPFLSVLVSVFILLVAVIVYLATQSNFFTVIALLVLIGSLTRFFFPTSYVLDERGITVKTRMQKLTKEWQLYRSCYPDRNGILLSPFGSPSRLENFRGLYVMFERNGSEVIPIVKREIERVRRIENLPPQHPETAGVPS